MKNKILVILFILSFNFIYADSNSQSYRYLQLFDAGLEPGYCEFLQIGLYWILEETDYVVFEKYVYDQDTTYTWAVSVTQMYNQNPYLGYSVWEGRYRITATARTNNNVFLTRDTLSINFDPDIPRIYTAVYSHANMGCNYGEVYVYRQNDICHDYTWRVNLLRDSVIVGAYQFQPEEEYHVFTNMPFGNYKVKFYYNNIFFIEIGSNLHEDYCSNYLSAIASTNCGSGTIKLAFEDNYENFCGEPPADSAWIGTITYLGDSITAFANSFLDTLTFYNLPSGVYYAKARRYTALPGGTICVPQNAYVIIPPNAADTMSLTGHIKNSVTGEPITNAVIELTQIDTNYHVSSDPCGNYGFRNLPLGNYTVKVSKNGFNDVNDNLTIIGGHNFKYYSLDPDGQCGNGDAVCPKITSPAGLEILVSGEDYTIQWQDIEWSNINISCILNYDTPLESEIIVQNNVPGNQGQYVWMTPGMEFSFQTKIILENTNNPSEKLESSIFRLKPYHLTKVTPESIYQQYLISLDGWSFNNTPSSIWDPLYYARFNYRGDDPFTEQQYSQYEGNFIFKESQSSVYPDWISWVNTFSFDECYLTEIDEIYNPIALLHWKKFRNDDYKGNCFGMSLTNALYFGYKESFMSIYQSFPNFDFAYQVFPDDEVRKVFHELHTHQWGVDRLFYFQDQFITKDPTEILNELKSMFIDKDNVIKLLLVRNNSDYDNVGHALIPIQLIQDPNFPNKFEVQVYDCNNSGSTVIKILFDIQANNGKGTWSFPEYQWSGTDDIYLSEPITDYFEYEQFLEAEPQRSSSNLSDTLIRIFNSENLSVKISDEFGNILGHFNNNFYSEIVDAFSIPNFSPTDTFPKGYFLKARNYSVELSEFESEESEASFFKGNKFFTYNRSSAVNSQTDKLYFDDGLSVSNPDAEVKSIGFHDIVLDKQHQKVFIIRDFNLNQTDSVKIENPNDDKLKLTSYGSAKNYDLEINLASNNGLDRFNDFNVSLPANSSHTLVPVWSDISNNELVILQDIGNNGTIDDTLRLENEPPMTLNLTALIQGMYNPVSGKMVSDVATVYLRSIVPPFNAIDSSNLLLDSLGQSSCLFSNAQNEIPYYIVVKHRNSIETWSSSGQSFTSNSMNYDFTSSANKAFGNNLILKGSKYCIFSGDVNQDDNVDVLDLRLVENDVFNFVTGYVNTDVTGDNVADALDLVIIDNNAFNFVSRVRP